jgi:hypothetical protein
MSGTLTDRFETGAACWIHRLLVIEEEHRPLPDDPNVTMLVLRVSERLSLAAEAVQDYELARDDQEGDDSLKQKLVPIAVYLLGAAGFALTAIANLTRDDEESNAIAHKDGLLEELDAEIAATIETDIYLEDFEPARILSLLMSYLTEASQCAIELEGVNALDTESLEEDDEDEVLSIDELLVRALWGTAAMAGASAEFLIARSQE